jgi:uncharacterized membrane protein YeaQ/YmgE (transglycosylase-associated protein family)
MNWFVWLVFGGLAGWVATIMTGTDGRFGVIGNIVIGIIGAWLGGWIAQKFFNAPGVTGFDFRSFVVAVLGAIVLLFLAALIF